MHTAALICSAVFWKWRLGWASFAGDFLTDRIYKRHAEAKYAMTLIVCIHTVYPKKYAHGFVVLGFVVVMQSFIMNSHEAFIHIHQGCFAGTGAIVRLPQCQWSKPDGYGKISQCITTTKHSKAKTVCIFLGIYCKSCHAFQEDCDFEQNLNFVVQYKIAGLRALHRTVCFLHGCMQFRRAVRLCYCHWIRESKIRQRCARLWNRPILITIYITI